MIAQPNNSLDTLNELLISDLDIDTSAISGLVQNLALNLILTSFSRENRLKLYQLLGRNDYSKAKLFILHEIPNFHEQLMTNIKTIIEKNV